MVQWGVLEVKWTVVCKNCSPGFESQFNRSLSNSQAILNQYYVDYQVNYKLSPNSNVNYKYNFQIVERVSQWCNGERRCTIWRCWFKSSQALSTVVG